MLGYRRVQSQVPYRLNSKMQEGAQCMEMPNGGVWNVQALYLRAGGGCSSLLVRRNGEYHHGDVLGYEGVIADGRGNVLSSNVYDAFGVSMYASGSAQTPYRPAAGLLDEEGLIAT